MYDILFVSKSTVNDFYWKKFKEKYPTALKVENVKSFDDLKKKSFTKMFWVVWNDTEILDSFDLIKHKSDNWDKNYIHCFLNDDDYYGGICLFPKTVELSQEEFDERYYKNKKEIDIKASRRRPYDIVFISYDEIDADKNFEELKKRFPLAQRIHGIKGIHQAHREAARISSTDSFWVVDADAEILESFDFEYKVGNWEKNDVHVWRSKNPINDLEYGYGGVKLFPRNLILEMKEDSVDMTTAIGKNFKIMEQVSNITKFNVDEFSSWKSAFRECVKLSSKLIKNQVDKETEDRLLIWKTKGEDRPFGKYCIAGAISGSMYGEKNKNSIDDLRKINDFDWLRRQFEKEFSF